jgi:ribosomal protein S28E/S33
VLIFKNINNAVEERMKKGDIVRFKEIVDAGDETVLMELLENPDGGRVLVRDLVDMAIQPTSVYPVDDLIEISDTEKIDLMNQHKIRINA